MVEAAGPEVTFRRRRAGVYDVMVEGGRVGSITCGSHRFGGQKVIEWYATYYGKRSSAYKLVLAQAWVREQHAARVMIEGHSIRKTVDGDEKSE
jgi:hypothetical protein